MGKENFMITHDLETYITNANNTLLYRQFEKCLQICENGLHFALRYPEVKIANEATETLCTVALQAFVESGRWQEAVPFVGQVYGGFENCPAQIIQYSILLHANMLDWSTCSALVNVWLRTTQTATIHEYAAVVELYVINVLEPQERWEDVTAFLESCKNLPANIVAKLLQESHARKQEFMATQLQRNNDSTLEDNSDEIIQQRSQIREQPSLPSITQYSDIVDIMASHLTTAFQWFVKCISKPSRKTYSYGALCLVLFYLLIRKTRLGGVPNALLLALWTKLMQLCTYCLRLLHIVN